MANSNVPSMTFLGTLPDDAILYIAYNGSDWHTTGLVLKSALNYRMNNLEEQEFAANTSRDIVLYTEATYSAIEIDYWWSRNSRIKKGRILIQNLNPNIYLYETQVVTIPLDDDCGVSFTALISGGSVVLRVMTDNSDAEAGTLRYYSQLYIKI